METTKRQHQLAHRERAIVWDDIENLLWNRGVNPRARVHEQEWRLI